MKTKEELNALKEEVETLNKKLAELTEDELQQVAGGATSDTKRFYTKEKGFGFIEPESGGRDTFVQNTDIKGHIHENA